MQKNNALLEPWQDPSATPYIELQGISKNFGSIQAVNNMDLTLYKGEIFSILGESGCGKSTLLRILAGLETPTDGKILIDGQDITNWPPYKRPVNMMFQSYALFPHMSVFQNVLFGLKQENISKKEMVERAWGVLDLVKMTTHADRKPTQLSGGQKQRVALARSLVKQPKLLLLDEPLGALDKQLREHTQFELVNIQESVGINFIIVTHDQEEAMTMSSRIGVMNEGQIHQIGPPFEIYEYPSSRFVAGFIGGMNIFDGIIKKIDQDHVFIECPDMDQMLYVSHAATLPVGSHASVAIRPEKIMMSKTPLNTEYNFTKGVVNEIAYLGDMSIYYVVLESGRTVEVALPNLYRLSERDVTWEDEVYVYWRSENGVVITS